MAEITKHLGIAIADADADRITKEQLLGVFQDAIDNGDILLEENTLYVIGMLDLIEAGILRRSRHVDDFEQRMSRQMQEEVARLKARPTTPQESVATGMGPKSNATNQADRFERCIDITIETGEVLKKYIAIHNDIFRVSLNRILPIPFLFSAIEFPSHCANLSRLSETLENVIVELRQMPPAVQNEFWSVAGAYASCLKATIDALCGISERLNQKVQNPGAYTWKTYRKDLAAYKESVSKYRLLGKELNRMFGKT